MAENEIRVSHEALHGFVSELFQAAGMPTEVARFYAWSLVQTNLWGIDSHGVLRTKIYVERVHKGAVNPRPVIRKVRGALAPVLECSKRGWEELRRGFYAGQTRQLRRQIQSFAWKTWQRPTLPRLGTQYHRR